MIAGGGGGGLNFAREREEERVVSAGQIDFGDGGGSRAI